MPPKSPDYGGGSSFFRAERYLRSRKRIVHTAVMPIDTLQGPGRRLIGDAIAEQARNLAPASGLEIAIPERDALILNRP
ncbi:MAG: hypothetical protein H7245_09145 [Candidatus Saccharibacteria bacterium]|nr:hypothetical protein [Pseudorhodobacter sp.]